ncbi:beta-N-acetylhexosaminidase [Shewanella sairae]|uniref:beta-N-acetylhexosaminidase n=1 Tax=Shewanella sairae TaxID=190310 RepID=A0ABQ4PJQ3_9GAMM|nr:family 20 glycosylhydrolase [Shewanella sairae]MCL1130728.1 carbohydate-binding domain-containing protein [Shewanella sairae]GIU47851.1 beta-N-acetylhexosaminidase [Shewanella sairae]
MKNKTIYLSLLTTFSVSSYAEHTQAELLQSIATQLQIQHEFVDSNPKQCPNELEDCYLSKIHLQYPEDLKPKTNDWNIYFSQLTPVQVTHSSEFSITHLNGDLHRISPTSNFHGFKAGEPITIEFYSYGSQITRSEFMPNYFVHTDGLDAIVIDSTRTALDLETGLETQAYLMPFTNEQTQFKLSETDNTQWASAEQIYASTESIAENIDISTSLIPQPSSFKLISKQVIDLSQGINLTLSGLNKGAIAAAINRLEQFGFYQNDNGIAVNITVDDTLDMDDEDYLFSSQASQISIQAKTDTGAFYALTSLAGLVQLGTKSVASVEISDSPRYSFRGLHIDVARNFLSKAFLLKTIDQMAAYKLNKLHLHLADDEGWRIEIPGLPELSNVGGKRCFNAPDKCLMPQLGSDITGSSQSDGYYSVADYQDILAYAKARHIQVIPSLDMPGHSRAAIHSMEARYQKYLAKGDPETALKYRLVEPEDKTVYSSIQHYNDNTLNVCMDSTYNFIDKVIGEVQSMHSKAGMPLTTYHIGADETAGAWINSPACDILREKEAKNIAGLHTLNGYFIERVSAMLASKNIKVAGWNDGMGETRPENMPQKVQTNSWSLLFEKGHIATHKQANHRWDTIISTPEATYFDFPYQAHPKERGNHWASREISTRKVFEFMPDNLPAHAEFWFDKRNLPYISDDSQNPLAAGIRYKGVQGHLWSEMIRSDSQAEYMLFPRLLALAERAWHKADWELDYDYSGKTYDRNSDYFDAQAQQQRELDWQRFASVLAGKELAKLALADVFYRIPTVGAKIDNGYLKVKTPFPFIAIEYQQKTDESVKDKNATEGKWLPFKPNTKVSGEVKVRAISADGVRKGRTLNL